MGIKGIFLKLIHERLGLIDKIRMDFPVVVKLRMILQVFFFVFKEIFMLSVNIFVADAVFRFPDCRDIHVFILWAREPFVMGGHH